MNRKISILTFSYTLFIILLFVSGSLSGIVSDLVYYSAFILPIAISLYLTRDGGAEWKKHLTIDKEGVKLSWPLIFPTVSAIILISYITSLIIYAITGRTNYIDLGDSYPLALITHALIPAIFEEALFRYLPMRLLAPHSPRCAVIVSAFFFALVHHDLFSIPYAFLAGVIFMAVDLVTESVIPSVIIHFINNALSVGMIIYSDNPAFAPISYIILGILSVISACVIISRKKEYQGMLAFAAEKGEGVRFTPEMIMFAVVTLVIAVVNLL